MNYSVYDSTAYAKGLESRNGLFSALIIIGVSRNDEVLDCISTPPRSRTRAALYVMLNFIIIT